MDWTFYPDSTSNFSYDKAKYCEYGDCDSCEACEEWNYNQKREAEERAECEAWDEGRKDGEVATRTRGGTRGAEWMADQKNLTGTLREEYISGFNSALDEAEQNNRNEEVD